MKAGEQVKTRKLKYRIAFYFISIILSFGAVSSAIFLSREYKSSIDDYKNTCSSILKNIEPNIAELLYVNDLVGLNRLVDRIWHSNSDFVYCFVTDPDNKVIVHTFDNGFPAGLLTVNRSKDLNTELLDFGKVSVYDFSYPIVDGKLGSIRIGVSRERLVETLNRNLAGRIALLCAFVLAGILAAFYLSRKVTIPLSDLVESADRISGGDFDHEVTVRSDDEVGRLSGSFNKMRLSLKEMTEALEIKIRQLNETNEEYLALNEEYEAQNDELLRAKEKAEECDRLKTAFIANLSHEIRTPMNGILGFAELLKTGDISKDSQDEYIEVIEESGQRMLKLISDLVDISAIESGQVKINLEPTDVNRVLEKVFHFFRPEAEKKGIKLRIEKPATVTECEIITDSLKLEQILSNLVHNALKFTSHGKIVLSYSMDAGRMIFTVKDTGKGIPEEMRELIFERFRQVDEMKHRKEEGSGLGLSICKSFVELLGGEIWVESELFKGSSFRFTIPLKHPDTCGRITESAEEQRMK